IDHTHPLFLQPSDTPRLILNPIQLTGFVTRKYAKEMYKDALLEEWETCNAIERFDKVNRVRIFQLHRSISRLSQGSDSVSVYFTKLKELWAEYDVLVPFPDCGCARSKEHMVYLHQQRVMQFLDGLNDTYEQARRQILMKTTEPTLNQAYVLIIQDESQQSMGSVYVADKGDPLAMQAGRGQGYRGKKQFLQCDHCRMKGHIKENCFKIIGYPEDFKGRRPFQPRGTLNAANHVGGSGSTTQTSQETTQSKGDYFFTEAQYHQILGLLNNKDSPSEATTQANNADIWIVDSGAIHHIFSTLDLMSDVSKITDKEKEKVTLPNGGCAKIEHTGSSFLSAFDKLKNVLHVPDFKFNLMSVSKLTRDLSCAVIFLPELCVFQDLYNGRVKAIGKEDEGLYVL
ncbi:hypothetical protein A4A49_65313, partial [Nicotiana attenuata]